MHIHPTEYESSVLCIKSPQPLTPATRALPRPTSTGNGSRWGSRVRPFVEKDVYPLYTRWYKGVKIYLQCMFPSVLLLRQQLLVHHETSSTISHPISEKKGEIDD